MMRKISLFFFVLFVGTAAVYGQRAFDRTVHFNNVDGFTGRVKYRAQFENYLGAASLKYGRPEIVITDINYVKVEDKAVLAQHGINVMGNSTHIPESFSADVRVLITIGGRYLSGKIDPNTTIGTDYTTFDIPEEIKAQAKSYRERTGKDYWEDEAGFYPTGEHVEKLYLLDLKNEIDRILREHRNQQKAFEDAITRGTSAANEFNFTRANEMLAQAQEAADGSYDHKGKISKLEELVKAKTREREKEEQAEKEAKELAEKEARELAEKEKAEQAERESRELAEMEGQEQAEMEGQADEAASNGKAAAPKDGSAGKSSSSDDSDENEESSEGSTSTPYIPKTNTQLYNELKAMTDAAPGMLNDPNIRKRLRDYKVYADRERSPSPRQMPAYMTSTQGGRIVRQDMSSYNRAMRQVQASNQRIDQMTIAVGDLTDALASGVNSYFAAKAEREKREAEERRIQHEQKLAAEQQQREDEYRFLKDVHDKRDGYINAVARKIAETYGNGKYEPKYIDEDSKWHYLYTVPFVNNGDITVQLASGATFASGGTIGVDYGSRSNSLAPYRTYVVEDEFGKFGLLDDDGEVLYPPQFDKAFTRNRYGKENGNYIGVQVDGKWGELHPDGSIKIPIVYDYIFYLPKENKILKLGNNYLFDTNTPLQINGYNIPNGIQLGLSDMKLLFPGGVLPVTFATYQDGNFTITDNETIGLVNLQGEYVWNEGNYGRNQSGFSLYDLATFHGSPSHQRAYFANNQWFAIQVFPTFEFYNQLEDQVVITPYQEEELYLGQEVKDLNERTLFKTEDYYLRGPFSREGLAATSKGYIDRYGELAIPAYKFSLAYDGYLGTFKDGYAVVQTSSGFNIIDIDGNTILDKGIRYPGNRKSVAIGEAYKLLGDNFYYGRNGFGKDFERAFHYYSEGAALGSAGSQGTLGLMYYRGEFVERDQEKTKNWLILAAENGHTLSAMNLGFLYKFEGNARESVRWFEKGTDYKGVALELGSLYYKNETTYNISRAIHWFTKAAASYETEESRRESNFYLGEINEIGLGVKQDKKLAKKYYTSAASLGSRLANAKLNTKVKGKAIVHFQETESGEVYQESVGGYKAGKREGEWKYYYENGQLKESGQFQSGKKIGEWKEYYENGQLKEKPLETVEILPSPPGGLEAFYNWISENYVYPDAAIEANVSGNVITSFVVERDGSLADVEVVSDVGFGTGAELVRVIQQSGKWSPGIQNGRPVRVAYKIPITLK